MCFFFSNSPNASRWYHGNKPNYPERPSLLKTRWRTENAPSIRCLYVKVRAGSDFYARICLVFLANVSLPTRYRHLRLQGLDFPRVPLDFSQASGRSVHRDFKLLQVTVNLRRLTVGEDRHTATGGEEEGTDLTQAKELRLITNTQWLKTPGKNLREV